LGVVTASRLLQWDSTWHDDHYFKGLQIQLNNLTAHISAQVEKLGKQYYN